MAYIGFPLDSDWMEVPANKKANICWKTWLISLSVFVREVFETFIVDVPVNSSTIQIILTTTNKTLYFLLILFIFSIFSDFFSKFSQFSDPDSFDFW